MQTLDQLGAKTDTANAKLDSLDAKAEKRTPISSLPFTASASGSYYLTGNLQFSAASGDAISINANDVSLDLNGFTLSSTAAVTGNAIAINGALRNIAVRNGVIAGNTTVTVSGSSPNQIWTTMPAGFGNGIRSLSGTSINCQFSHLRISGCRGYGLNAGAYATIDHITATLNGSIGIAGVNGSVTGSTASSNGNAGISSAGSVTGCTTISNGATGISAAGSVTGSTARANGGNGISAVNVTSSNATSNGSDGISATTVTGSTAISNGSNGISGASVIAFCTASANNAANNGSLEINAVGATRTGNFPTP